MKRKIVLLVEDDRPLRQALRDALMIENYEVIEASNFSEAINQSSKPIQLAVIDYSLPDRDGIEILTALRVKIPSLPAILITAYGTEDLAIRAFKAGITDYVKKPFSLRYLVNEASQILDFKKDDGHVAEVKSRAEFFMESAVLHIQENFREKELTLGKAASLANMNRYSFSRAFKKRFGQNFASYRNGIRLGNAVELLKNNLLVKEIAFQVGFRSAEYFARLFKRQYGVSPSKYRENSEKRQT